MIQGQGTLTGTICLYANTSHTTVKQWLSILEASFLVFLLKPWHENFNKRAVKSPKLFFYDTGLACALLGIRKPTPSQCLVYDGKEDFIHKETRVLSWRKLPE